MAHVITSKVYHYHWELEVKFQTHLSLTVCLHKFAERSMPFDFELYNRSILTSYLEVNVVVLRLHSLLQQKHWSAAETAADLGNLFCEVTHINQTAA